MTELEQLYAKKQEIRDRRSRVLRTIQRANSELGEINDEYFAVNLEILRLEEQQNGTA